MNNIHVFCAPKTKNQKKNQWQPKCLIYAYLFCPLSNSDTDSDRIGLV